MFRETVSNADGTFFVSGIIPGMYQIEAEMQGYKKYSRKDLRLEIGKTGNADVRLEVGFISEETVNVTGGIADRRRHVQGGRRQRDRA